LGRFDHAPQQSVERRFVGGGDARGFRLGNEVGQAIQPDRFI
jgi:hypothetical protein